METRHDGKTGDAGESRTRTNGEGPDSTAPGNMMRDKVACLDGLRGIACLVVFNYHFLWPWTPLVQLGFGASPAEVLEPCREWLQLPIVCLLHRGRAMVAVFFAISGYVVCRSMLRYTRWRRVDAAYKRLASAALRRVFRLYLPPALSMAAVAVLAQAGAFRSETDILTGPDSIHINGTWIEPCFFRPTPHAAAADVVFRASDPATWTCFNQSSTLLPPLDLYKVVAKPPWQEQDAEAVPVPGRVRPAAIGTTPNPSGARGESGPGPASGSEADRGWRPLAGGFSIVAETAMPPPPGAALAASQRPADPGPAGVFVVRFGGSWEEHPRKYPNLIMAVAELGRTYLEWANPFYWGHLHPPYDAHTFTLPMELRGSLVLYLILLATAAVRPGWRMAFCVVFAAYALYYQRWEIATFVGGMAYADYDLHSAGDQLLPTSNKANNVHIDVPRLAWTECGRLACFLVVLGLYCLSYPDTAAENTPGFMAMSAVPPRHYPAHARWQFWGAVGALMILPGILRIRRLRRLLETRLAQYLGSISFSLYLVHGPVLHSLGFWIMPRLFNLLGRPVGFVVGWLLLLGTTLCLSGWWHRHVDMWCLAVGRRVERRLTDW